MNFRKSAKGGSGSFSIQKFILQILGTLNRTFWSWNWYKIVISRFRVGFFNNCIKKNYLLHLSLEIMCMHFILSSYLFSSHICNYICHKNLQYNFPKMRGGWGWRPFEIFTKNSSDLVAGPFPKRVKILRKFSHWAIFSGQPCHSSQSGYTWRVWSTKLVNLVRVSLDWDSALFFPKSLVHLSGK